jgi:hypothetical protein
VKIFRKTRPNIEITELDELIIKLKQIIDFRNITENNKSILADILNKTFQSPTEFNSYIKSIFKIRSKSKYISLGFSEEEIENDIKRKSEIANKSLLTRIKLSGLSKDEYHKRNSHFCKEYWIDKKGFSEDEAVSNISNIQKNLSKRVSNEQKKKNSPRTLEYWIERNSKNPELDRSNYQKESSPRCIAYWLKKGMDPEDSLLAVQKWQGGIAKIYYNNMPKEEIRKNNHLCREYYEARGLSHSEIDSILSDNGRTFSLDIAIKKYGEEGYDIWKTRQDKWQNTLNSKSVQEIIKLNSKKAILDFRSLWDTLSIPGIFYLIEIDKNKCKIGITSKSIEQRYRKTDIKDKKIKTYIFDEIHNAFQIEQITKRNYLNNIKKGNEYPFGWTEVIHEISFDELELFINNIYKDNNKRQYLFEAIKKK